MQPLNVLNDAVHLVGKGENSLSVAKYCFTRFCQSQFSSHAVQKRRAKRVLKLTHLNRHGRLTDGKCLRRLRETLQPCHHIENVELVKIS